eukprot:TRINITY_DN26801_c0_g1_i1.p1 TRINITY_DN26801_c0_g1~~TRINITY_DN26801_c0_g1_i1.p1  ORF type:complete len:261 (+),score=64.26 TRINITY_DN26801_c0_g1_i1:38-820(+)
MSDIVLYEKCNGVATITLNRPDRMNALSAEMRAQIKKAFAKAKEDQEVGAIVLTARGKAFTAGLDLMELASGKSDNKAAVSDNMLQNSVGKTGKPVICGVNGFAITGGFELALMADFLIASVNAKFADTHAQVGIVPGWGLSQKFPRLVGLNRAKEISFTGRFVDAEEALRIGLVNRVVPEGDLGRVCQLLAEDIVSADARTLSTIKKITDEGYFTTLREGLRIEAEANEKHMETTTPKFLGERRKIVMARNRRKKNAKL